MKTFGEFVREKRDALDISLREFAKKLGDFSPAHISDIENGKRYPSADLLGKFATILGVSIAELKKYDSRPPVDELKRMAQRDPIYGVAFRKIAENKVDSQELLDFIEGNKKKRT
jgi:transcriptional regulator with XRE-family HTH domain